MSEPRPLRVAMTMEQSWHRVPGGTAVAALALAGALEARPDVEVVGVSARHRHPPPAAWAPPVSVRQLPLPRSALYESWHRLRRPSVERATGPVDVIHATALAIPPRSAPLVVTLHDLAWLADPDYFTARGLRLFNRALELARSEADLVLCSSEQTMRDCARAGIEVAKLRVVPLGVRARRATEEEVERVRDRYGLVRSYVLWVGTVEPRKNLRGLLAGFARLELPLDLALVGPMGWHEDLDALVAPLGERAKVLGFVPSDDLGPLYAGAAVFCFPSFLEGFGFPVLEAMAQGTPVVTSKGTSTEELAGDAGVLVDPRDTGAIADGLRAVLSDVELAAALADAGRARAASYTWERTADLVAAAYRDVA